MTHINDLANRAGLQEIVPTSKAAALLNRKPRTLYAWSCLENGPIRPVRVHGRLGWRLSDIVCLLNGGEQ